MYQGLYWDNGKEKGNYDSIVAYMYIYIEII